MLGTALLGLALSFAMKRLPSGDPSVRIDANPFTPTLEILRIVRKTRAVFLSVLGISWFWFFGAVLLSQEQYGDYMRLLRDNFSEANLESLMCRRLLSVDWRGYLYDCDFNQMLDLPVLASDRRRHLRDLLAGASVEGDVIFTAEHCYGCTAGQGSSCGGALVA